MHIVCNKSWGPRETEAGEGAAERQSDGSFYAFLRRTNKGWYAEAHRVSTLAGSQAHTNTLLIHGQHSPIQLFNVLTGRERETPPLFSTKVLLFWMKTADFLNPSPAVIVFYVRYSQNCFFFCINCPCSVWGCFHCWLINGGHFHFRFGPDAGKLQGEQYRG